MNEVRTPFQIRYDGQCELGFRKEWYEIKGIRPMVTSDPRLNKRHLQLRVLERHEYDTLNFKDAYGTLDILLQYAKNYKSEVYDKTIVIGNKEENKIVKLPYKTRFSEGYYDKIVDDIKKLKKIPAYHDSIHLVLTVDPKRYCCMKDAFDALMDEWNRMRTWIRKHDGELPRRKMESNVDYQKRHKRQVMRMIKNKDTGIFAREWKGDYVAVPEFQNELTKLPHLHVVMLGCKWLDVHALRRQWGRYMGHSTFFKAIPFKSRWYYHKILKKYVKFTAVDYVLKYIGKMRNNFEHLAELWAVSARGYNASRGLIAKTKEAIFNSKGELFKLASIERQKWKWLESPTTVAKWEYLGSWPKELMENVQNYSDFILAKGMSNH